MNREEIIMVFEKSKNTVRQEFKAQILGIFGSFVRSEDSEDSDIDILVRFYEGATLFDLVGLSDFLEEKVQRKVDIVSERALRKEMEKQVLEEMVRI